MVSKVRVNMSPSVMPTSQEKACAATHRRGKTRQDRQEEKAGRCGEEREIGTQGQ